MHCSMAISPFKQFKRISSSRSIQLPVERRKKHPHTHTQIQRVREKEKNILLVTFSARSAGEHSVSRYLFKSRANHNYIREKRKNGDLMSISTSDILKFQPADGICHFNWSINLQNCKRK